MIISVLLMVSFANSQSGHCSSPYIKDQGLTQLEKVTVNHHKHETALLWQSHNNYGNCNIHLHAVVTSGRTIHTN